MSSWPRTVGDARHRLGIGQRRHREQRGDLRRGRGRLGRPAAGLADVDEANLLRAAALLGDVAQQPLLLRARDDEVALRAAPNSASSRWHIIEWMRARRQTERAAERGAVERHRAGCNCRRAASYRRRSWAALAARQRAPDGGGRHRPLLRRRARDRDERRRRPGAGAGVWRVPPRPRRASPASVSAAEGRLRRPRARRVSTSERLVDVRQLVQHALGHRIGLRVVADVDVEPVHHVEVRIAEELAQRRAPRPSSTSAAGTA